MFGTEFFSAIGVSLIDPLLRVIAVWWVAPGVALLIVVYALYQAAQLFRKIRPIKKSLRLAQETVRRRRTAEAFACDYEEIHKSLKNDEVLGHFWREFTETLLPIEKNSKVRNTTHPKDYINFAIFDQRHINLRHFQSVPNYLTGMGLLFTFVGLVSALYLAGVGMEAQDAEAMIPAIRDLLRVATFKFVTSVAGLFCSILFAMWMRMSLQRVHFEIQAFCRDLEERMDFQTQADLARKTHMFMNEQTRVLRRIDADLPNAIAGSLGESLAQELSRAVSPLSQAIDHFAQRSAQMNQDALQLMARDFAQTLDRQTGDHLERLVDSLNQARDRLDRLAGSIEGVDQRLARQLNESVDGMSEVVADATGKAVELLSPLTVELAKVPQALETLDQHLDAQIARLATLGEQTSSLVERIREVAEPLASLARPLESSAGQLEAVVDRMEQAIKGFGQAQDSLTGLDRSLRAASDQMEKTWRGYERHFVGLDRELAQVFSQLENGLGRYQDRVNDYVSSMEVSMEGAVQHLAAAVQELSRVATHASAETGDGALEPGQPIAARQADGP